MPHPSAHARPARPLRRRRDDDELRRVYREHVSAVFGFFGYAVSKPHAEDLTSATFERVIKNWGRFDAAKASERTWILAIARNQLVDHYRRQQHRDAVSLDEHPMLAEALTGADAIERRLEVDEVRSWLAELTDREQQVLALRYGADLAAKEIAELLELSDANVHQILSRTLRKLREQHERTLT